MSIFDSCATQDLDRYGSKTYASRSRLQSSPATGFSAAVSIPPGGLDWNGQERPLQTGSGIQTQPRHKATGWQTCKYMQIWSNMCNSLQQNWLGSPVPTWSYMNGTSLNTCGCEYDCTIVAFDVLEPSNQPIFTVEQEKSTQDSLLSICSHVPESTPGSSNHSSLI